MAKRWQVEENKTLREAARLRGDKYYEAVSECKRGHLIRRVSDGRCEACKSASDRKAQAKLLSTEEGRKHRSKICTKYQTKRYKEDPEYRELILLRSKLNYHKQAIKKILSKLEGAK